MKFPPTDEQQAAIDAFASGANFVLEAGAGTGKTSTLQFLAESAPRRRGLYLAFNSAIAAESRTKFPSNITVKTTHALAMAGTSFQFQPRLKNAKVPLKIAAARLGITSPVFVGLANPIRETTQASLTMQAVRRFCSSDDEQILKRHVPRPDAMTPVVHAAIAPTIVQYAKKAWADLSDPNGSLYRFEHDHYLKAWALSQPPWGYDFVLFDEAQDTNPVVSAMVTEQLRLGAQVVAVGDSAQSIYGWRGAVDAMETFAADSRLRLSKSFRFGPAIAEEANKWLQLLGSDMRLSGLGNQKSKVVDDLVNPNVVLCRNNSTVIGELFLGLEAGKKVGVIGDGRDLLAVADAAASLKAGRTTDHEEFSLFGTWGEVVEYAESGDDPNLLMLTKIVDEHGPAAIKAAISRATDVKGADLVLSTAHKAKGGEWDRVRLAGDFAKTKYVDGGMTIPPREELMLCYVAVTRAQDVLDRGVLGWVDDAIDQIGQGRLKIDSGRHHRTPIDNPDPPPSTQLQSDGLPYRTRHPAYSNWTAGADAALLRRFRAGVTLTRLTREFVRTTDEVESRLYELLGRARGSEAVFGSDDRPLLDGVPANEPSAGPLTTTTVEPSAHQDDAYYEPDEHEHTAEYDEPIDPLEGDPEIAAIMEELDDWEEISEGEEDQASIRATFEYLMQRDDI
ncbi:MULTISPECIES: UvrD-helicase domain-containing protein [unclassified Nocardioides]|uniref:UvrD-helicase domain-containing protein n=1 Tax=unclassified Nocardioides TaxID=2615069 RepID=UPI0006F40979|nr:MULTISPECIES: UvrD-helicase domain-containing protein [unclassified Nocardioides]KRA37917.1 hypothetical protein ASD81_04325 [Nocardioides sp. Root614]KRA91877.1 hypothetical protein ASD84_04590 [Nocardioides sp. Root682]